MPSTVHIGHTSGGPPTTSGGLTPLHKDIIRTLLYFDVFRHPLRTDEIFRFLPSNSVSLQDVEKACASPPLSSILRRHGRHYAVPDGDGTDIDELVKERAQKEHRALRMLRIARFMGRCISAFPFVRGVFVSGELSKGVAREDGDVDFVVVTSTGRVWIARTLLIGFKKIFLLNNKRFLCLNHIMSERALEETNRNRYTAIEIGTLFPVSNAGVYHAYLRKNSWITSFLPNIHSVMNFQDVRRPGIGRVKRRVELMLSGPIGDRVEHRLLDFWRSVWRKRYPEFTEEQLSSLFRCDPDISTAYIGNFQPRILGAYEERLRRFNLDPIDASG